LTLENKRALKVEDEHPVMTSPPLLAESFEDEADVKGTTFSLHHSMSSPPFSPTNVTVDSQSVCVGSSPNTIDNSECYEPLTLGCPNIFGARNSQNSSPISRSFDSAINSGCGSFASYDAQGTSATAQIVEDASVSVISNKLQTRQDHLLSNHSMNTPSYSFDSIDFRTGMSGHRALTNSKSHVDNHTIGSTRTSIRMMSQHNGVRSAHSQRRNRLRGDISVPTLNILSSWIRPLSPSSK